MATQAVKPTAAKKKRALRQNTKPLLLIALPGILYLLINNYLPMIGIFLAFKDYSYINNIYGYKDRAALSGVVGQSYLNYLVRF